ncbi:uncharacterized protein LOC135950508 [Calliphora vicina]|uniref:uncharacterized protein LOC135950508 n=1 Tax=Calliphora vicina TaxID=7373 RepID=UPI00325B0147
MANEDETAAKLKSDLSSLKSQRTTMKRTISNLKTKIEKEGSSADYTIIECRLQMLESYFKQVSHIQTQIERLDPSDEGRTDLEEIFIASKSYMVDLLNKKRRSSDVDQSFLNTTSSFSHQNRLPKLKLPTFDGKYCEYSRFITTFKMLVHDETCIPTIDKFNYLLNCLSGQALALIEPLQVIEENYQKALDSLRNRYDNKSLIFIDNVNTLFSISPINKPSSTGLRAILDNVAAIRSSLLSLGSELDVMNAIIIHIVLSKIDSESKAVYDEKQDFNKLPSWDDCYSILSRRCQFLESRSAEADSFRDPEPKLKPKFRRPGLSLVTSNIFCEYCQSKDHFVGNCASYLALPVPRRFDFVKSSNLCINCLRKGHMVSKCISKSRCRTCRVSHHTSLHNQSSQTSDSSNSSLQRHTFSNPSFQQRSSSAQSSTSSIQPSSSIQSTSNQQTSSSRQTTGSAAIHLTTNSSFVTRTHRRVLLPTAIVLVRDKFGTLQPLRALLDSCSEINLITQETANRLRLSQTRSIQDIAGVSDIRTQLRYKVAATVKSRISEFEFTSIFSVTKSISSQQPAERVNISNWNIPSDVELADPEFYLPQRIDLLLSSEIFFDLLLDGKVILGEELPCLINTKLGWIIGGKVDSQTPNKILSCNVITYQDLDTMLKAFWEIEEFAQNKSLMTEEENQCESHFIKNTVFDETGRVKVRLPFKFPVEQLGSSFETAHRRFIYLEKRLQKDEMINKMYIEFMQEYISLGHMSLVSYDVLNKPHYVIPHHSILRPQSSSTKLRVVFDASAHTSTNKSLNEILMVGPTIQQELIIAILCFRFHKFAMSADICKMYRQFLVHEEDRNFQLVLWRDNGNSPLDLYQLNTVTYGTSAAPFLAIRSLSFIADTYKQEFPIGSHVLKQDFYVDDLLTGSSTLTELLIKKTEITQILDRAGLKLSKWSSNYSQISHSNEDLLLKTSNENITKALGMYWKPDKDVFCFQFELSIIEVPTKRLVLGVVARIFDVLGLLSPVVVSCKILIQEMWKQQIGWDIPLNEQLQNRWLQIEKTLPHINQIEIPRFVGLSPDTNFDIHGFSDASQLAYGCCLYIRVRVPNGFQVNLLIAKSKVAPVVQQSLPRLELCAALLLSRTWAKIKDKFQNYMYQIFFWSDSKIVLNWLKNHSSSYVCFVANRVSEIQNTTNNIPWRHVPSKENPADIVSRGCLANELASTSWFRGPDFLMLNEKDWPKSTISTTKLPSSDIRKTSFKTTIVANSIISEIIKNQSSFLRILHIIVYIHRLFHKPKRNSFITSEELQLSFWKIVHDIQQSSFRDEICHLQKGITLQPALQKLSPFLQDMPSYKTTLPILRVGGRLANASLSFNTKFPALLPKDHRFTTLYIKHLHLKHLHAGPKALLGILRQQVWVTNARDIVRKIVRNCIHCFKYKPRLLQQIMGDLPADRLKAQRPFFICGVDFCGPFYTSYRIRGKPPYKTYVAIFVCFASKAIHIELVSDLSTNCFILCLKRFIGRRGIPHRLYCDNATNFVGANARLNEFKQRFFDKDNTKAIMEYSEITGFQFKFIPPRSPHFGGLWESAVKSTKTILVKNMSNAGVTYEELQTILVEVEAILNSRPIAPRSDDPNDGEALTPGHMLIGSSLLALPDENLENHKTISYLKHWQMVTYLKQQFWTQWVRDYVLTLQQKAKWFKSSQNIQIGRLVIVHEDNIPPQQWLLARIVKVIPGRDEKIRVVDVQTSKGILRRSIHKIAPLPIDETN